MIHDTKMLKTVIKKPEPTLQEAQEFVGGFVEAIHLENGDVMLVNEEGKLKGLEPNMDATRIWEASFGPTDIIAGPALVIKQHVRKDW